MSVFPLTILTVVDCLPPNTLRDGIRLPSDPHGTISP